MTTRTYRQISKAVRAEVDLSGHSCPIVFEDGFSEPHVEGKSFYFTTPGGKPIRYPSAYARKGRVVYHASTLRIVVGKGWVCENVLACSLPASHLAVRQVA